MRFILALWVVVHHISGPGLMMSGFTNTLPYSLQILIRGGYLAVQTFFVLSGFVLAQNYGAAKWHLQSLRQYVAARIARIYPVYAFSLLVVSPFIWDAMFRPTRPVEKKISLLVDYTLLLQGWKGNLGVGWNTPAWTLSCEIFFYFCFPLLLPLIVKAREWSLLLVIVLTIVVPSVFAQYGLPGQWKPIYHLADFVAGVAASRIFEISKEAWRGRGAWLYVPAAIAGVALIIHPQTMDGTYGDLSTGLRPLNVLALVGLAWGGGVVARWLSGKTMDFLGKASYSLYILHVPVLWWYSQWALRRDAMLPRLAASILYLLIVVGASAIVFKWIEVPMNKRVRRALS
ncbi:MAG: acyltransferase 3 [Bryobacterales bacterium]|nr:acyltransferase 3 [Bryobacterales bacterium]